MPLFWLSLAFLAGVLLASTLELSLGVWLLLTALALGLLVLRAYFPVLTSRLESLGEKLPPLPSLGGAPLFAFLLLAFAVLFLGAARYRLAQPSLSPESIAWYNESSEEWVVVGIVVEPPDVRDEYLNLKVRAERLRPVDDFLHTEVHGLLLARLPTEHEWHYGDRLILQGYLETPPEAEDFSYRDYLTRQGVYTYMPRVEATLLETGAGNPILHAIYAFKERALASLYRLFPDPEASLFAGILLGVESGIPGDVQAAFNRTGTSHIIAISGFNITILAGVFVTLFSKRLGATRGAMAAVLGITLYTFLVGAEASVVRAAIMGGLALFARQVGRRQLGLNTLAFTAALMALFNPLLLWDVGFQLSFAATLGLLLYAEPLNLAFRNFAARWLSEAAVKRLAGPIGEYLLFTLAAQLTTLPLIIYHFHRLSLSFLPANLAILPAQPPIMILGGMALLFSLLLFPLGQLLAYFAWPFAAYTIRAVEFFDQIPGGSLITGEVSAFVVLAYFVFLFILTFYWPQIYGFRSRLKPTLVLVALSLLTVLTWTATSAAPDGLLHLTLLDVGAGEALLVQSPTGRYLLIDGGSQASHLSDALGRRLPLFHRELDYLVIANPIEEHIAALPRVVERFLPAEVLWAGPATASSSARLLQEALVDSQIPIRPAQAGQILELGADSSLELLSVDDRGAVLLLEWERFRALLPLGLDFENLDGLQTDRAISSVIALLLADGGYAPLNPPELIRALDPQVLLLSVEAGNYDGLPSPQTVATTEEYTLLRTDQNGWIQLSTDGQDFWVQAERAASASSLSENP